MALFRKTDKSPDPADPSAPSTPSDTSEPLHQLTENLGQMGELLADANRRIADYLACRDSQSADEAAAAALEQKIDALAHRIERLSAQIEAQAGAAATSAPAADASTHDLLAPLAEKLERIQSGLSAVVAQAPAMAGGSANDSAVMAEAVERLRQHLDERFEQLAQSLAPDEQADPDPVEDRTAQWQEVIFGPELSGELALAPDRWKLIDEVLAGDPAACAFAAQMLLLHSSPTERLPQLLKDLGEAYYRWQPKTQPGATPMENALVAFVERENQAGRMPNTIELIHPGERFDAGRHAATGRGGVEITEVRGWIVLRENGRVYTKASVAVR